MKVTFVIYFSRKKCFESVFSHFDIRGKSISIYKCRDFAILNRYKVIVLYLFHVNTFWELFQTFWKPCNMWIIILYPDILMPECSIKWSVIILFTIPGPRNIELHAYYPSTKCNYFWHKWDMTNECAEVF